ncbi:MAG TPA: hypothetical protein VFA41_18895 [Ktedonobacteraceae bacterium]|nr:hypothetical protein [Ktedonobacteraceae bacterium]
MSDFQGELIFMPIVKPIPQFSSQSNNASDEKNETPVHKVPCSICDAVYAPAPEQSMFLEQSALEAAFMSACHYCFRCRRPACPQCWDEVHGVCGACVEEVGLPFRRQAAPLDGLLFPPAFNGQADGAGISLTSVSELLIMVRPGRFTLQTLYKQEGTQVDTEIVPGEEDVMPIALSIPTKESSEVLKEYDKEVEIESKKRAPEKGSRASSLESILTWLAVVILLAMNTLIVLAYFLPTVNLWLLRLVNIDIHAEITYLVHIIQQLFKK